MSTTEHLIGEVHESEVLPIVSTLLMLKAENIYRNTQPKLLLRYSVVLMSP